jgi:ABC-type microcin C transport system duplicated ATPase subunit YejF
MEIKCLLFWRAQADAESRLRMLPPRNSNVAGSIRIAGEEVLAMDDAALERLRGGVAAMIFQEPMLALDIYANPGPPGGRSGLPAVRWHGRH